MTWRERGLCRGMDPDLFVPENGDNRATDIAKAICETCPVRWECLEDALATPRRLDVGVRGGYSAKERGRIRSERFHRRRRMAEVFDEMKAAV